jgi:hypothetical protein
MWAVAEIELIRERRALSDALLPPKFSLEDKP